MDALDLSVPLNRFSQKKLSDSVARINSLRISDTSGYKDAEKLFNAEIRLDRAVEKFLEICPDANYLRRYIEQTIRIAKDRQ